MNKEAVVVVCVVALVFTATLVFSFVPSSETSEQAVDGQSSDDAIEVLKRHISRQSHQTPPSVDRKVDIVVPLGNETNATPSRPPHSESLVVDRVSAERGQRFAHGSIPMSEVRPFLKTSSANRVQITNTNDGINDGRVASGVTEIAADRVDSSGEDVTVGIIDTDFRISHPAIASQIRGYAAIDPAGEGTHGTAVASVVTDTAPNASLALAAVGSTTTAEEYASAIEWFDRSGVDIIVDAGSYYAQPGDGNGSIARIAENATEQTVFVTSVGNHNGRFWSGNHTAGEWVTMQNDTQANPLNNGDPLSGSVELTLRWDGWPTTSADYDLYLLRAQPGEDTVVARATGHDGRPFEHLETSVPRGRYYVSIRNATDDNTTHQLELFATHELRYGSIGGETAPATSEGVIAVGAVENGSVQSFSAHGADIVAPDSVAVDGVAVDNGTSFSTPYVAGTGALVLASNPKLTPAEVRTRLLLSADDVAADGVDPRSGHGVVNATEAVNRTTGDPVNSATP